jgi:hypothetical protein
VKVPASRGIAPIGVCCLPPVENTSKPMEATVSRIIKTTGFFKRMFGFLIQTKIPVKSYNHEDKCQNRLKQSSENALELA